MNYWITCRRAELLRVLRRVHVFLLNDAEAQQLTGAENVLKAAEGIRMMGPAVVVIKRGEYGALARTERGWFSLPAFPVDGRRIRPGAGDSFAGGMIGYLCRVRVARGRGRFAGRWRTARRSPRSPWRSSASEGCSVSGTSNLRARVRALAEMTRFDPD